MRNCRLVCIATLLLVFSSGTITPSMDDNLDPGPIGWWTDQWNSRPIEISRNNAGTQDTTFTFRFKVTRLLENGCVFIYFPAAITPPGAGANNELRFCSQTWDNLEQTKQISLVDLPTAGAYGPFSIETRQATSGQIVDANYNFGSVYITNEIDTVFALTVSPVQQDEVVIKTTESLYFQFNLRNDLWMHDTLVLKTASHWTTPTAPSCESIDIDDQTNYFVATDSSHQLDCVSDTTNGYVFVYGLANDIDISEQGNSSRTMDVKIKISGYTAPQADWPPSNYDWQLEIFQWRSNNVLAQYEGIGPKTVPDSMVLEYWEPHNGFDNKLITKGLTIYTDVSFVTKNAIPANGFISVNFSGADIGNTYYSYQADLGSGSSQQYSYVEPVGFSVTETVTSRNLWLTMSATVEPGTEFKVTVLPYFESDNPSITIYSYDANLNIIDVSNKKTIDYASNSTSMNYFYAMVSPVQWNASNEARGAGDKGNYGVNFTMKVRTDAFASTDTGSLQLYLPFSQLDEQDFTYYINNESWRGSSINKADIYAIDAANADTGVVKSLTVVRDQEKFEISSYSLNGLVNSRLYIYSDAGSDSLQIPKIVGNKATRYESWAVLTYNTIKYIGFRVMTVESQTLSGSTVITRQCGNFVLIAFNPVQNVKNTLFSDKTYYLELEFDNASYGVDLESGLTNGSNYPFTQLSPYYFDSDVALLLDRSGTNGKLQLTGQDKYSVSTTYSIYTAVKDTNGNVTFRLYYLNNNDSNKTKYVLEEGVKSPAVAAFDGSDYIGAAVQKQANSLFDVQTAGGNNINTGSVLHFAQFPNGFTFEDPNILVGTNLSSKLGYIQSDDINFKFPGIVAQVNVGAAGDVITVQNVRASPFALPASQQIIIGQVGKCSQAPQMEVTTGEITVIKYYPTKVEGRGPRSYSHEFKFSFVTSNGVPQGGQIVAVVDNVWTLKSTSCTTTGLSGSVSCVISGSTITITGFDAISGNTVIGVKVEDTIPPTNGSGTIQNGHIDSIITQVTVNGSLRTIDTLPTASNSSVSVTAASSTGVSLILESKAIPDNTSFSGADFYLRFRVQHPIPSGSVITIQGPEAFTINSTIPEDYVFFSKGYSSVIVNTTQVSITTNEYISPDIDLELYITDALTTASTNQSTAQILITTTYSSISFDADTNTSATAAAQSNYMTVTGETPGAITVDNTTPITLSNNSPTEAADYTFLFSSPAEFVSGDEIWIQFPREYSPYVGQTELRYDWFEPQTYYIDCASSELGQDVECIADHWYVKVINGNGATAGTSISLTIENVINPPNTGLTITNGFTVLHMDQNMSAKATGAFSGVTIAAYPSEIQVRRVGVSNPYLSQSGNYQFDFYTSITPVDALNLMLYLPRQFNTDLAALAESGCALTYINHSDSSTDLTEQSTESSTCSFDSNWSTFTLSTGTELTFDNTRRYIFRLNSFTNPEWGLSRSKITWYNDQFEVSDEDVYPLYDSWTDQVQVFIKDTTNSIYLARSYLNTNQSWLGFEHRYRGFKINDFDGQDLTENFIKIIPGTQSQDITISTRNGENEPLSSKSVVFTPSVNSLFTIQPTFESINDQFTMFHGEYEISFRIGIPNSSSEQIFYVDFAIEETIQDGQNSYQYDAPQKLLVEVAPVYKAYFEIDDLRYVTIGNKSRPIRIHTDYSPSTDVQIDITLPDSLENITVNPTSVKFVPNMNHQFFEILVNSSYSEVLYEPIPLTFTISGTDSGAYQQIETKQFYVSPVQLINPGSVTLCKVDKVSENSVKITAKQDSDGVIMVAVAPQGIERKTYSQVLSQLNDYFRFGSDSITESTKTLEYDPSNADQSDKVLEGWTVFQRRIYGEEKRNVFYMAMPSKSNENVEFEELKNLPANMNYNVWCYANNNSQVESSYKATEFETYEAANSVRFIVKFWADIPIEYLDIIGNELAFILGISPLRLQNKHKELTSKVSLNPGTQQTEFSYTISPDIRYMHPTPLEIIQLHEKQLDSLRQFIEDLDLNVVPIFKYEEYQRSSYLKPSWTIKGKPELLNRQPTYLQFQMQPTTTGQCCCIAVQSNQPELNQYQILAGLDQNNQSVVNSCNNYVDLQRHSIVTVDGLTESTTYSTYCTCFNDYPVWPDYIDEELTKVTGTTLTEALEEDFAKYISAVIFFLLV